MASIDEEDRKDVVTFKQHDYEDDIAMEVTISSDDLSCTICDVSFLDINENYEQIVNFFIQHNVLRKEIRCEECLENIELNKRDLVFRCGNKFVDKTKKKCYFFKSAKKNTILEHNTIRIKPFFNFVAVLLFLKPPRNKIYRDHLKLGNATFSIWSKLCRDILVKWNNYQLRRIGGLGRTIEIDISNICGGPCLIFGGICRETKEVVLIPIEKKYSSSLIKKLIEEHVEIGSTIITKHMDVYEFITEGTSYTHYSVKSFLDESTGAHINHIQRLWRDLKINVPHHSFKTPDMLLPYVAEYKFKRTYTDLERMHHFFKAAACFY